MGPVQQLGRVSNPLLGNTRAHCAVYALCSPPLALRPAQGRTSQFPPPPQPPPHTVQAPPPPSVYKLITRKAEVGPARGRVPGRRAQPARPPASIPIPAGPRAPARPRPGLFTVGSGRGRGRRAGA